jgi:hypothetical protein
MAGAAARRDAAAGVDIVWLMYACGEIRSRE